MAAMRAKMKISSVERTEYGERLTMNAVAAKGYPADGSDEDNTYAKFSPAGDLRLTISNPALAGKFNPGETYYIDFTLADAPAVQAA